MNELLSKCKLKVVVHKAEADALKGLAPSDVIKARAATKSTSAESRFNYCTRPATRQDRSVSSSMGG